MCIDVQKFIENMFFGHVVQCSGRCSNWQFPLYFEEGNSQKFPTVCMINHIHVQHAGYIEKVDKIDFFLEDFTQKLISHVHVQSTQRDFMTQWYLKM